jgi:hypothetical protein
MLLRLAPGVLKTRPDGLKQFRTLTGASPRIIENRLQCELRKHDPMSIVQSRVEIVGYLLVSLVILESTAFRFVTMIKKKC